MIGQSKKLLILPHLKIHNANALSSPFTIGFPAMTAWLGATHALERKLKEKGSTITVLGTGVVSHQIDLQTYKGENDYVASIVGTGNPLDKTGARSAFIEEARCHLEVSLIMEIRGIKQAQEEALKEQVTHILNAQMKIAGGDIRAFDAPETIVVENGNHTDLRKLRKSLMPGYALIERRDLMIEAMANGQDAMDAMLDYLAIHHSSEVNDRGEVAWHSRRKTQKDTPAGWIVPIATGFQGISDLGVAKNQRDADAPHRFAESLVTLGEFKMLHRFESASDILWRYQVDTENDLYQCTQMISEELQDEFG